MTKVNILLVDDRPENLLALEAMLDDLGENLVKAHSGEEALRHLLHQDFAAILLDVQMPSMDGFETAALIKQRDKSRRIPIIFITALNKSDAHIFRGYSVGAVDYVLKPVVPEILKAKVAIFVELFKKTEEIREQSEWIHAANARLENQLQEVQRLNRELTKLNESLEAEIEEREAAEASLRQSEHLYRTLAGNLPQTAIFLFDHELRCVLVEGDLFANVGYPKEVIEGRVIGDALPQEFGAFWKPYCQAALSGEASVIEIRYDDSTYCIQTLGISNRAGEIYIGLGVVRDITDIKVAEEALRVANDQLELRIRERTAALKTANDELTTFTYVVSHDLRAPLLNLKGFASELNAATRVVASAIDPVLSHFTGDEAQTVAHLLHNEIPEALKFISSAVTRMDRLTAAVLNLSRLGHRELILEPIDMNDLVQTILNSLAHQIKERNVTVTVQDLPDVVADRIAIEQIMGNLLVNAVIYLTDKRPGHIEVSGEITGDGPTFHIRDNGRGIAEHDRGKIFEPFRRAGSQDVHGEGMGLAYVKALIHRHAGSIWFESKLDVGTTFSIVIPGK